MRRRSRLPARSYSRMKTIPITAALGLALLARLDPSVVGAAELDGIALAIVYDTSGSMKEKVRDAAGKSAPKYVIANRALTSVATQIQHFVTNTPTGEPRQVQAALFVFAKNGAREVIKMDTFTPVLFRDWARDFKSPQGGTPLGTAVKVAAQSVQNSALPRKHILVITDGQNTVGPDPAATLALVRKQAGVMPSPVSVHFVAFDVDSKIFDGVKRLGATVVGAANEAQLNTQIDFILQKKILLEDEEPPRKN